MPNILPIIAANSAIQASNNAMHASNSIDLSNNQSDCIKAISNIGSTTYQNICSGSASIVPWGSADWIGVGVMGLMTALLLALIGVFIKVVVKDMFFN